MRVKSLDSKLLSFVFILLMCISSHTIAQSINKWWDSYKGYIPGVILDNPIGEYTPGFCDNLFSAGEVLAIQYRQSPAEQVVRTITLRSVSEKNPKGIFIGSDNYNWEYGGEYTGDHFNFGMKSGVDEISGKGLCTKYGAIGVFKYTNKVVSPYHFLWVKKNNQRM